MRPNETLPNTPSITRLSDYIPPNFEIKSVSLDFDLSPQNTLVKSKMDMTGCEPLLAALQWVTRIFSTILAETGIVSSRSRFSRWTRETPLSRRGCLALMKFVANWTRGVKGKSKLNLRPLLNLSRLKTYLKSRLKL